MAEQKYTVWQRLGRVFGPNSTLDQQSPVFKFDKKELEMGIKVEFEHTNLLTIATSIAKDHLSEISDYYTRLDLMEKEGKKGIPYGKGN